jgi:hypothetical protein
VTFIRTVPEDEADGPVASLYEADVEADGFVNNSTKKPSG